MCNLPRNTAQSVAQQQEKDYSKGPINPWWQGWLDSNQRMRESKSLALPLGYTPIGKRGLGPNPIPLFFWGG